MAAKKLGKPNRLEVTWSDGARRWEWIAIWEGPGATYGIEGWWEDKTGHFAGSRRLSDASVSKRARTAAGFPRTRIPVTVKRPPPGSTSRSARAGDAWLEKQMAKGASWARAEAERNWDARMRAAASRVKGEISAKKTKPARLSAAADRRQAAIESRARSQAAYDLAVERQRQRDLPRSTPAQEYLPARPPTAAQLEGWRATEGPMAERLRAQRETERLLEREREAERLRRAQLRTQGPGTVGAFEDEARRQGSMFHGATETDVFRDANSAYRADIALRNKERAALDRAASDAANDRLEYRHRRMRDEKEAEWDRRMERAVASGPAAAAAEAREIENEIRYYEHHFPVKGPVRHHSYTRGPIRFPVVG